MEFGATKVIKRAMATFNGLDCFSAFEIEFIASEVLKVYAAHLYLPDGFLLEFLELKACQSMSISVWSVST